MTTLATIGYQGTTVADFLDALRGAKVELLVDVRAVVSSRRPGFAKTALAANLETVGIDYLHLRGLGTPAEGRAAVRSGHPETMHRIYREHLRTAAAKEDLEQLVGIVRSGRRVCLLCFEADPENCHRTLVADAVRKRVPVKIEHLRPGTDD